MDPKRRSRWWKSRRAASRSVRAEIGPEARREVEFRIGAFPEEKVAEPALAAATNQEVDIRPDVSRCDGFAAGIIDGDA